MKSTKQIIKTLLAFLFLITTISASYSQQEIKITQEQANLMKKNAEKVVKDYAAILQLIGMPAIPKQKKDKLINNAKEWFESSSTRIHNDLSSGGSDDYSMHQYFQNVYTWFAKKPVSFRHTVDRVTDIHRQENAPSVFVKVETKSQVNGINNEGKDVKNSNHLDFYVKFPVQGNTVNTNPKIFGIFTHKPDLYKFDAVKIVPREQSTVTTNNEEFKKKEQRIKAREQELKRKEVELNKIKQQIEEERRKLQEYEEDLREREIDLQADEEVLKREKLKLERQLKKVGNDKEKIKAMEEQLKQINAEIDRRLKLLTKKRFAMSIGLGGYYHWGTLYNIANNLDPADGKDRMAMQINGMLGYRFDYFGWRGKNIHRGTILGIFGRYCFNTNDIVLLNSEYHQLDIPNDELDRRFNPYIEVEGGFVFNEFFRFSTGFGFTNQSRYYVSTVGINSNLSFLKLGLGVSALYGKDFKTTQLRPSASLSFQFNDGQAKKVRHGNGLFHFDMNIEGLYYFLSKDEQDSDESLFAKQLSTMSGIKFGRSVIGVFASYGLNGNYLANRIVTEQEVNPDQYLVTDDYNRFSCIEVGGLFFNSWRLSWGKGKFYYSDITGKSEFINYQIINTGVAQDLTGLVRRQCFLRHINFKLDLGVLFSEDIDNTMFRLGFGAGFKFGYARLP